MKRFMIAALVVGVVAVFGVVSLVNAQDSTPPAPGQGFGYGRGMMGGRGGAMMNGGAIRNGGMMGANGQYGPMHELMQKALAEKLGLTEEQLEAAYTDGKTFWDLAEEKGLTTEEAQQAMLDARTTALDALVADGTLTQEQADWMKSRGGAMMNGGYGAGRGGCPMGGQPAGGTW
jgi:hypothetical protein